jgi:hypothetical protein
LECLGGDIQDNNGLSVEQMKAALTRKGISQLGDAYVVEVLELYETVLEAMNLGEHGIKTLYPLYPTSSQMELFLSLLPLNSAKGTVHTGSSTDNKTHSRNCRVVGYYHYIIWQVS